MRRNLLIPLISLFLFASCGSDADKIDSAIEQAHLLLTDDKCSDARDALDAVGYQEDNAEYIGVYASTYACEGNYSTITFFGSDLDSLGSAKDTIFGSLTLFSTSGDMTSSTDTDFIKVKAAIDTILYSGGQTESSSANREAIFGTQANTNLNVQALYMTLVNLGRWLKYYGNPDSDGVKGGGSDSNNCLYTYDTGNVAIDTALSTGVTGACTNTAPTGSTGMMAGTEEEQKTRLCQGIVLFTNFVDLISNIQFTGDSADGLNSAGDAVEEACDDVTANGYDVCTYKDQSACEALTIDELQLISIFLFETLF